IANNNESMRRSRFGRIAMNTKNSWLQVLRAVASIMVLLFHARPHIETSSWLRQHAGMFDFFFCGVDIFFVLSGFVIYHSAARAGSVADFTANRLIRIFGGYWPAFLLLYLISGWGDRQTASDAVAGAAKPFPVVARHDGQHDADRMVAGFGAMVLCLGGAGFAVFQEFRRLLYSDHARAVGMECFLRKRKIRHRACRHAATALSADRHGRRVFVWCVCRDGLR